ncbi:MAG: serine/threonine protein kinase [Verrucomicrobiales bacterium]|jgi:serine/threonine protein kinase
MSVSARKLAQSRKLHKRSRLGKYRIESCLAEGHYSNVYRAFDTIEHREVAIKIPHGDLADEEYLDSFRKEVRLAAKIDSPRVVGVKDASYIDKLFVMAYPMGVECLTDRLARRTSTAHMNLFVTHAVDALACLHSHKVIHCDIKPDNFIVFSGPQLKLADLGIARKSVMRTVRASGSGTLGHMSPDQAMGRASMRADVFALGLMLYRMASGKWPEYPFDWPPPGYERFLSRVRPEFSALVRKCIQVDPRKRFRDGVELAAAFHNLKGAPLIPR